MVGGPEYLVNIDGIISASRRSVVRSIAVDKYGEASGRLVEVLQRPGNQYMEQQALGEKVVLPAREARERLYRLYRSVYFR